jgi:hypothetical protein
MISIGYNPYLNIIVKQYACYNKYMCMLQDITRYVYGKKIMELEATYKCSQGKDTLYMYMTN